MQVIERIKINDILDCSGAKLILLFYGYTEADDKNYISKHGKEPDYTINFALMRNDNVRFIYYDEEDNKFTLLSGELKETGNNGDNNIYFFESSDFSAQFSLVSSYLKFYIDKFQFLFLSYNDVHSDNSTKGAGNITCISEECANQEVSTKQCEGEIKVSLILTGDKEIISQLQDLPVYMYIDYSKEIIDSTITLSDELTAKSDFGFKAESKSNLSLRFSFYKSLYNTTKTGNEIETLSHSLHIDKGYSGSYEFNDKFNAKYFPDIIEITGIKLLSYNDKSLEILLLSNVKNTDKKSTEILKYIKWKFFVTDKLVDDRAVEKTAGLSNKSITIYDLDDKIYNNSIVSGNKLQLYYTDKFLELYNTVIQNQNSSKSLVLYPYIAYRELNINKQNEEYLKHALVIRNSGINKFTGVLSVTISEVKSDEHGIYIELEAHHNSKLVTPQINDVKWGYLILDKACIVFDKAKIVPMEQYGKTIKVYYNEEWYNKYLYFFPYYKSVDINLYSLWHIEQPVSLKFNGERLQILEEGKVLKEYEARSGIAVKKRADTSNNTQEVPYPLEPLDKYFYYDEQSTSKILEGEYYIIEEALEANSAELVGELYSGLYKNSLGSRYMDLYKSSDVSFINIAHFNQMILERKNYFFKSDTLNKIHGGIDYEDKGGIDLSTGAYEFFKDLTKIIKYKPLYKVSGKIPIKLEVKYIKDWHDPLDKMEICLFSQGGHYKPWNASFGETRENIPEGEKDYAPRDHTGVDLFAPIGMPVYACLDGVYHIVGKKYGTAYLVVDKDEIETLKNMYNKNYKIIYNYAGNPYNYNVKTLKGELLFGSQFNINSPNFVIRYQHLSSFESKLNGKHVKRGTIIGRTGITGAGDNNYGPHLHFEIGNSAGTGLNDKANPAAFVNIKFPENVFTKDTLVKLKGGKSNADLMNDVNYLKLIYPYFKEQVEYLLKIAKRNDLLLKITGGSV